MTETAPLPPALAGLGRDGGIVHGTAVCAGTGALLILGRSGAGKSTLALRLIALGASLVADDRVVLTARPGGPPRVSAPARLGGLIEARGVGLLRLEAAGPSVLAAILDLDKTETARLPPRREIRLLGAPVRLFHNPGMEHGAEAMLLYLRGETDTP